MMTTEPITRPASSREAGFTLLEAVIAIGIVGIVTAAVLAVRTNALIDATEARNWRVAREVAQEILSELSAGAREQPLDHTAPKLPIPAMRDMEDWRYQIIVGEERISSVESEIESQEAAGSDDNKSTDRRAWQQERDDLRRAQSRGMSFYDYRENAQFEEEERLRKDDAPPSEDEFEEVAVVVYFPNVRPNASAVQSHFILKARLSTMAIEGVTPQEAETMGNQTNSAAAATGGNSGGAAPGGQGTGGR